MVFAEVVDMVSQIKALSDREKKKGRNILKNELCKQEMRNCISLAIQHKSDTLLSQ